MDATVTAAISAVRLDDDTTAQRWFEHVCATHQAEKEDWSAFTKRLTDGASDAGVERRLVEQFVEFMNNHDSTPLETIRRMSELSTELPAWHRHLKAEAGAAKAGEPAAAAGGGYDESAWHAFLPEFGAHWDGTDAVWGQFRTWFLYQAGEKGLSTAASGFITYVEGTSDKVAAFAQYGVRIGATAQAGHAQQTGQAHQEAAAAPDVSSYPEVKHGDTGQWVSYLDTMLTRHGY